MEVTEIVGGGLTVAGVSFFVARWAIARFTAKDKELIDQLKDDRNYHREKSDEKEAQLKDLMNFVKEHLELLGKAFDERHSE